MIGESEFKIVRDMLGSMATGDYLVDFKRYDAITPPVTFDDIYYPIELGAWLFRGNEAKDLICRILNKDTEKFLEAYPSFVVESLSDNWDNGQYRPSFYQCDLLKEIISSPSGIVCQSELIDKQIRYCVASAESCGVTSTHGQMMWVECQLLGGLEPVRRIFARCGVDATLDEIMDSLNQEANEKSSTNLIGNDLFGKRHAFCKEQIEKYIKQRSNTKEDAE